MHLDEFLRTKPHLGFGAVGNWCPADAVWPPVFDLELGDPLVGSAVETGSASGGNASYCDTRDYGRLRQNGLDEVIFHVGCNKQTEGRR